MSALGNREEIKDVAPCTADRFWDGPNATAYKATILPDQIRAVLNQAEQEKQAADQRPAKALELMLLRSKSVDQRYHRQSRYKPRFKVLERDLCP